MYRLLLSSALLLTVSAQAPPAEPLDKPTELRALIERYSADRGLLSRFYNIGLSPTRAQRMQRFYADWSARLAALPFEPLSQDGKVDYILFRNHLQRELRQFDLDAQSQSAISSLVPFAPGIVALEESRRKLEPLDARKAGAALDAIRRNTAETQRTLQASLRSTPVSKARAWKAAGQVAELRGVLARWFNFYNGYDPLFTWWAAEAYRQTDSALNSYAAFLREQVAGVRGAEPAASGAGRRAGGPPDPPDPNAAARVNSRLDNADDVIGDPIGREALISDLAFEMIPYTPEELIAIANRELAWCENEMRRASRELGYGDDWKKALEQVKGLYVEPGRQPTLIRDLAREAEAFLDQHNLLTIPPLARETWRMEMMSPERQLVNPFFTGGEVISVSFPVDSMTYDQKMMSMRGKNIHFSRATVFHELIPGHELQLFMSARYKPYRALFATPFYTEGWALYWELLLWDMQFQKGPEDRIGALFWRMHRCARIIFSLSFHLGRMTPQQCIDLLVDRVGHERSNAIGEVRRSLDGSYPPLYQAAYLLGGLQLRALRSELVDPGRMTNRQFHDAILQLGRIPIEMVRASLNGQPIPRDWQTNWKFYGPIQP
ncbi:MAG: DUF885 family protein [Acidobacteria bacterium]|nr:DUF885 family protein [Acidobacteriota bacterium]